MSKTPNSSNLKFARCKALAWLAGWWQIVSFGTIVIMLALMPSTYRGANRRAIAHQIVHATLRNLAWFTVFSALISIVLIRIVVVTALSYGLSRFAIEMVVRVLIVELIPLTAAMFVALRYTLPESVEINQMYTRGAFSALRQQGIDPIQHEFLPRVLAGVFSMWMLGAVSCIMTLVLAYLMIYGFTYWAVTSYTRIVGQVFDPAVTIILVLKIFLFSLAVSFIPLVSMKHDTLITTRRHQLKLATELDSMVRLFVVVLVIEVFSLMGNYY
jgi:phospholipid/cholesterol/gamma-HCH transport system permease protein